MNRQTFLTLNNDDQHKYLAERLATIPEKERKDSEEKLLTAAKGYVFVLNYKLNTHIADNVLYLTEGLRDNNPTKKTTTYKPTVRTKEVEVIKDDIKIAKGTRLFINVCECTGFKWMAFPPCLYQELTPNEERVLMFLLWEEDREIMAAKSHGEFFNGYMWKKIENIERFTGKSRNFVLKGINELFNRGFIWTEKGRQVGPEKKKKQFKIHHQVIAEFVAGIDWEFPKKNEKD